MRKRKRKKARRKEKKENKERRKRIPRGEEFVKRERERKGRGKRKRERKGKERKKGRISRCFDGRSSMVRVRNLVHVARSTCRHQKLGVSTNFIW